MPKRRSGRQPSFWGRRESARGRRLLFVVCLMLPKVGPCPLVGERCVCGEAADGNLCGVYASENVGISSEKTGENPVRRKPKVS